MSGIILDHVEKHFKEVRALNQVSLVFEPNKIYGLLGKNGAGKTTLLNAVTNRIFIDGGNITIDGAAITEKAALNKLYLMSEKNYYPEKMPVMDCFRWSGEFYPNFDMNYAKELSDQFELQTKKRVKELSTGYTSIMKNIIALSVNVPYVLLDEPVLGLDANHRELFYRILLEKYSKEPFTAVISTHLIEEVSNLIEEVVIIKKGSIIESGPVETLLKRGYTVTGAADAVERFIAGRKVLGMDALGGLKTAYIFGEYEKAAAPEDLSFSSLGLQSLFIRLTEKESGQINNNQKGIE